MYGNDDLAYVSGRLVGTIVRYNNRAVEIKDLESDGDNPFITHSFDIDNGKLIVDHLDNYDLTPVKLGWVNDDAEIDCSYYTRAPMRQDWRQGFRAHNCRAFYDKLKGNKIIKLEYKWLAKTINEEYPTLSQCIDMTSQFKGKQAWCRDFALNYRGDILYKMYGKVGRFVDGLPLLDNEYTWVEESLKEVL